MPQTQLLTNFFFLRSFFICGEPDFHITAMHSHFISQHFYVHIYLFSLIFLILFLCIRPLSRCTLYILLFCSIYFAPMQRSIFKNLNFNLIQLNVFIILLVVFTAFLWAAFCYSFSCAIVGITKSFALAYAQKYKIKCILGSGRVILLCELYGKYWFCIVLISHVANVNIQMYREKFCIPLIAN